jgi:uncharacterized protein (DUF2141 family)
MPRVLGENPPWLIDFAAMGIGWVLIAAAIQAGQTAESTVDIDLSGLRSARGTVHVCLTSKPKHFPDCKSDPAALRSSAAAGKPHLHLDHVPPGRYAIAVFHDENSNRTLDKLAGIPKEGFAFSRNPSIRFRAPRFEDVAVDLTPGANQARLKMHYLL